MEFLVQQAPLLKVVGTALLQEADEIVVVTPSLDRDRRIGSYVAIADAWRQSGG